MRRFAVLPALLCGATLWSSPVAAASVTWTVIDVRARLDNDGRFHVVETHHLRLDEGGGFPLYRELARSADQSVAFGAMTRYEADGSERVLERGDEPDEDHFQYHELGHVSFRLPKRPEGTPLALRFEYELVGAMAPAWAIGAGPGSLDSDTTPVSPLSRLRDVFADWSDAWPEPGRRYRLDHDVLLPSRQGPGYVVERIDYRLEFDTAWRRLRPGDELAVVEPDDHYRVRHVFEFLQPGAPPAAATRQAAQRLATLVLVPAGGILSWLALVAGAAFATRGWRGLDRVAIERRLAQEVPELLVPLFDPNPQPPAAESVLDRLAGERKLRVERSPLRLILQTPLEALPEFERKVLGPLFPKRKETSAEAHRATWRGPGFDPDIHVAHLFAQRRVQPGRSPSRLGLLTLPLIVAGLVLQVRASQDMMVLPLLLMADAFAVLILAGMWPRGWWHLGRPRRSTLVGLLLPLGMFSLGVPLLLLATRRPLTAEATLGFALVVLAAHGTTLRGARMRLDETGEQRLRELIRIRRFALAQLRRDRPALADAWIPALEAMGLGPVLARWRAHRERSPVAAPSGPDPGGGPPFTGRRFPPAGGEAGWSRPLHVEPADDDD